MNIRQAQLPEGWEMKKLSEVCAKITDGTHQTPKYFTEGVIFLSSKNVTSGYIDWENIKYIDEKQHLEMHKRVAPRVNDILLAKNGTTGVAAIVDRAVVFDIYVSLALLRPLNGLFSAYLLYFINSPSAKKQFNKRLKGIGVPNLHLEEIREVEIPFPPFPEQQRIVAILDEAFAAIAKAKANAEQNLRNAKELFESYLQGVFTSAGSATENKGEGWEEKTLGDICEFTQGIQRDVKLQSETQGENQVRFLRIVDFTQGNEPPRYIDNPGDKYILNDEDVSLVRYGASTGFVCRGLEGALANNLFRVIPKSLKEVSNNFLFVFLTSPVFQDVIKESMNGAAMPAISFGMIKEIPFPIISLTEQQSIVQNLDALNAETKKLESIYKQKIKDLEELKKSVLQKAFKGELVGAKNHSPNPKK